MIPIHQTRFGDEGNCLAACIASIFEVALNDVPHPTREELASNSEWARYLERLHDEFLIPRGVYLLCFDVCASDTGEIASPSGYAILNARSPRTGGWHAVVCHDGEIVHDPHPEGGGQVGEWHDWRIFALLDPNFEPVRCQRLTPDRLKNTL